MQVTDTPHIKAADLLRQGVIITFSDGITVLFPTLLLLKIRDHPEAVLLIPVDDDY